MAPQGSCAGSPTGLQEGRSTCPDAPGGLKVLDPFDLTEVLADAPDWTSEVDGLTTVELPGGGFLWGGDGSYGSDDPETRGMSTDEDR